MNLNCLYHPIDMEPLNRFALADIDIDMLVAVAGKIADRNSYIVALDMYFDYYC